MKVLLLTILAVICHTAIARQTDGGQTPPLSRKERRMERHDLGHKENNIFVTMASGYSTHNLVMGTWKVEYSRQIKRNFYWGTALSANIGFGRLLTYDSSGLEHSPYRNTVNQNIYKLDAMVYYRAPVICSRLFFRVGTGVGLGYHHISNRPQDENLSIADKVLPYINIEAAWILRCSRGFEMKFSPTILFAPSQVAISPVKLGPPTDVTPIMLDLGFSLTCGWRF